MEQHQKLDEFEEYLDNREIERTLFVKIWSAPRIIFRFIHENKYEKYMWLLLILAGISNGFDRASRENMGDTGSLAKIVVISILVGGLLGWISYYIYSALVSWIGQLFKGKADVKAIVRVMAYGSVPSIAALVMLVPQMIVYGKEMFTSNPVYDGGILANIIFYGALFIELSLNIWSIVLYVIGVSEVQQFPIWKAALNLLLPALPFIMLLAALLL